VEQSLHTAILFLESQLQELNDKLTSRALTTSEREQVDARRKLILHLIEHYRVHLETVPFVPAKRKPPVNEQLTLGAATRNYKKQG
jgi:hypothetical protein